MLRAALAAFAFCVLMATSAEAQITAAVPTYGATRVASLNDILVNSLHATTSDQQVFIRRVVRETNANRLEKRLVLAVMFYSQQQNATFPFPYFERIMRHEAAKRGVRMPSVAAITSSRLPGVR